MPLPYNPFVVRAPIRAPRLFIDRVNELRQVLSGLANPHVPGSFAVSGARRMGKTSFLLRLTQPQPSDPAPPPGTRAWRFIYIDYQRLLPFTPAAFWTFALRALADQLSDEALKPDQAEAKKLAEYGKFDDPYSLTRFFERLAEKRQTIIFLLDEFDVIVQSGHQQMSEFLASLRSLVSGRAGGLAYVVVTPEPLAKTLARSNMPGSPFANIFSQVELRPFARDDVEKLIDVYLKSAGLSPKVFGKEERDAVWEGSQQGEPELAQIMGQKIFDRLLEERGGRLE